MAIPATQVKELRDKTGAGFMDCKAALAEADGDLDTAVTILRTRGQARAAKRSGRTTSQGLVGNYIHMGGQVGVLVEVGCESDFVARTDEFQHLAREIAMHIAAVNPTALNEDKLDPAVIEKERASGFYGTPLLAYLQMNGIDSLIACGESTSGCVRATVVDGYSNGFHMTLAEECTFDRSMLSHKVNLFDLHHKYADVMHVDEVIAHLDGLAASDAEA